MLEHPMKDPSRVFRVAGRVTNLRLVHPSNADVPMLVGPSGMEKF
jgi:hypothetical protein